MGGFVKDMLYQRKDEWQSRGNTGDARSY